MTTSQEKAIQLLKDSSLFRDASDGLLEALSSIMIPMTVEEGHIFIEERQEVHCVMVLEKGVLHRTKLSVEGTGKQFDTLQSSLRLTPSHSRQVSIASTSVLVDTITGRGRTTGLLHNVKEGSLAYATVSAAAGPATVWLMPGDDFRRVISTTPQFALEVMYILSRELRQGSKSLRRLIERAGGQRSSGSSNGEEEEDSGDSDDYKIKRLKVLCYDATSWVQEGFEPAVRAFNQQHEQAGDSYRMEMEYTTERLSEQSATFAAGYDAVCLFVNDTANSSVLQTLSLLRVNMIAMRCAGFDRVDTKAARAYGHTVARVPAYSPYAVAEMAVTLLMAVNRKVNLAGQRVKMANFTLDAGLMGMDLHGKTVGVMGTGKIGQILCRIMLGFGCKLLCYDVFENDTVKQMGGTYVTQDEIYAQSDVLFLMMPLLPATKHTINAETVAKLKRGVILINTSRGGLVDTKALLRGLRSGRIGGVGMDVYEHEQAYFFQDWSARHIQDPDLVALLGQNNVVLTAHQAFFTKEAVDKIVSTTMENLHNYQKGLIGHLHPNNCIPALKEG